MGVGPGKYDEQCTTARVETEAEAAVLLVINGNKGSGFSVQAPPDVLLALPDILRQIAKSMEEDIKCVT